MNKTKLAAVSLFTITALASTGFLTTSILAAEDTSEYPSIVTKIAEKFNLDEAEVQAVFEEDREAKQDEHLNELVTDGTITQEQRNLLEAKQDEQKTKMDEIRDSEMTEEEKREAMDDLRREMENWLDENNINLPRSEKGRGEMRGPGRR